MATNKKKSIGMNMATSLNTPLMRQYVNRPATSLNTFGGASVDKTSFIKGLADILSKPETRDILASMAMATSATAPKSWQYQLAGGVRQRVAEEKKKKEESTYRETLAKMLGGKTGEALQNAPELSAQAATSLAGIGQREQALNTQKTGTMPWKKEYELAIKKMSGKDVSHPEFVEKAIDENGNVSADTLYKWRYNPDTNKYDVYEGPMLPRAGGNGASSVNANRRLWYNMAWRYAISDPEVSKYLKGGLQTDAAGNVIVQWENPTEGKKALDVKMKDYLERFSSYGMIPKEWADEYSTNEQKKLILD